MTTTEQFDAIASRHPALKPKVTAFPSGAETLDLVIGGVSYCAEFLPSFNAYGLSKTEGSFPFWEGFEKSFSSADALEKRILGLLSGKR